MPNIVINYSYWWLIVIVLIAVAYSYVLYRKDKNLSEVKKYVLFLLRVLRFITVIVLLFLLLNPLLKTTKKNTEKPVIAILQDNSSSIIYNKDSSFYKTKYLKSIRDLKSELSSDFETVIYTFGNKFKKTDSISFIEKETNISSAINSINDLYINRNLGAIILASDGIYNTGMNPKYINIGASSIIYTVLLGDTVEKKDVRIKDIIYNKDVFLGNNFPIEIALKSVKLNGEKANVKIEQSDKIILQKQIELTDINKLTFNLKAEKKGLVRYKISVETNSVTEDNVNNNTKEIVINVIESRKKILLLSNSPHPDVYAIKSSLANNSFYKVDNQIFNGSVDNLKDYDLIIFHQLPSKNKDISNILEQLNNLNISTMFIVGAQTYVPSFNKLNNGFIIDMRKKAFEETAPELNKNFTLFTITDEFKTYITDLPPVISYFANYKSKTKSDIIFTQKIRNIATDRPLFLFAEQNAHRTALISGEGIWRWRVYDYMQNKSFENFDMLINKSIQYLTANLKDNPLNVSFNKVYQTNEEIIFNAQFVNKSFERINSPDLIMQIKNDKDVTFNYSFDKHNDKYRLKIEGLEKGDYTFKASLKFAGVDYSNSGSFSVLNRDLESLNTVANHAILKQISEKYNAKSYFPNRLIDLQKSIKQNHNITKVNYYQTSLTELINNIWLFLLIVVAISLEWFIRKYSGGY